MNALARAWWHGLPVALVLACGGHVDLGGKPSTSAGAGASDGAGSTPVGTSDVSKPVAKFADDFVALGTLAVADSYLYLAGADSGVGLYRCRKQECGETLERVIRKTLFSSLQVYEGRLGVVGISDSPAQWIGSFALPSLSDPQIAIDLPWFEDWSEALFDDGFAYWWMAVDDTIYRCALPSCGAGPEQIGHLEGSASTRGSDGRMAASAELVFWTDSSYIYRAAEHGHLPAQRLEPDELLSESLGTAIDADEPPPVRVRSVTASAGMLYATLVDWDSKPGCQEDCPSRLVRWPASGGQREQLLQDESLGKVFVFGDELAWLTFGSLVVGSPDNLMMLSTCRIADCEGTRRDLGHVRSGLRALAADETDFYWLEAETIESNGGLAVLDRQIRRAPRSQR